MLFLQTGAFVAVIAAVVAVYFSIYKKKSVTQLLKILSLTLSAVFFTGYMSVKESLADVFGRSGGALGGGWTVFALILYHNSIAVTILLILYPFFGNGRLSLLVRYYAFPVSVCSAAFMRTMTVGIFGADIYTGFSFFAILYSIEVGLSVSISLAEFFSAGFSVRKGDFAALALIPAMLLFTLPAYVPQALFGAAAQGIKPFDFNLPHRLILYFAFIIPLVVYILLKGKGAETKRGVLLYISLGMFTSFACEFKFPDFANVASLPFHLCHTAMYLVPLCLVFRWKRIFYFTYFINVFGALLAMFMPNYSSSVNLFSYDVVLFYMNHYAAFFMPLLMVALGIYERPGIKQFAYSLVGFAGYYLIVLVLNAWLSNYGKVDYFFINSDYVGDKLGKWARELFNVAFSFGVGGLEFEFHPVYQGLYFIIYAAISAGIWFVYELFYSFEDTVVDIITRKKTIRADYLALCAGKSGNAKAAMNTGISKLVLENFSKRYSGGKVYAVKDASLDISGGDIFGFLGHNGAGKSTIIKSIVGIQPITEGRITVCGYDAERDSVNAKRMLGYVPDHYALYEKLTGRQYVNYIADLYGVSVSDRNAAIDKYVSLFELGNAFDSPINTYSHGMKQKVTIISALVHNPPVWILDEPLTGLDPTSIFQVKECMKQHAADGNIVFFSSHLIDVVESVCTKVAIIKNGHILDVSDVAEVKRNGTLEKYYLEKTSVAVERAVYGGDGQTVRGNAS